MPIPVELLREITLLYLSEAFWDLIVEPNGDDKNWDPLSSLLHTSSEFRQVTIDCILPIFGEPSLQKSSPSIANYRGVLAELRRINIAAYMGDPRQLLEPARVSSIVNPPPDCKSPLLQLARFFAEIVLTRRLFETQKDGFDGVRRLLEDVGGEGPTLFNCFLGGTPGTIQRRVFMPVHSRLQSLFWLVYRSLCLRTICTLVLAVFDDLWWLPNSLCSSGGEAHEAIMEACVDIDERHSAIHIVLIPGLACEDLPILQAVLEAIQLKEAWRELDNPLHLPGDDIRVEYSRRVKAAVTSFLSADEREALTSASRTR